MLLVSTTGIIVSQILYGLLELNVISGKNTTVLIVAVAAFSLHFGVYPLMFVLIPEIIPQKVGWNICFNRSIFKMTNDNSIRFHSQIRIYGVSCVFTGYWLFTLGFSLIEWTIFDDSLQHTNWQIHITSFLFNVICSFVFWAFIPSTRQKSYKEIFDELNCGSKPWVAEKKSFICVAEPRYIAVDINFPTLNMKCL